MGVPLVFHDPRLAAGVVRWRAFGRDRVTVVVRVALAFGGGRVELAAVPAITALPPHVVGDEACRATSESDRAPYIGRPEVTVFAGDVGGGTGVRLAVARATEILIDKRAPDASHLAALPPDAPKRLAHLREGDRVGLERDPIEIAEGFPWEALQSAADDQRVTTLHGDESVLLEGLVRGASREQVVLPGIRPRVMWPSGETPARLDRLHVDGASRRMFLTFRALLPVDGPPAREVRVVLDGRAASTSPWPRAVVLQPRPQRLEAPGATAVLDGPVRSSPATPFRGGTVRAKPPPPSTPVAWSVMVAPTPAGAGQATTAPLRLGVDVPPPEAVAVSYRVPEALVATTPPDPPSPPPLASPASALAPAPQEPSRKKPSLGARFLARRGRNPS